MDSTSLRTDEVEVLVVGAGQAGLSVARELGKLNVERVVYDREKRVGDSWRERFDSLVLFTPRKLSALPGLSHGGDPQGFPARMKWDTTWSVTRSISRCPSLPIMASHAFREPRKDSSH